MNPATARSRPWRAIQIAQMAFDQGDVGQIGGDIFQKSRPAFIHDQMHQIGARESVDFKISLILGVVRRRNGF